MKKFLVFTIILLNSFRINACGYSPYGEDVRYSLFLPKYFNYNEYYGFYYNNFAWGYDSIKDAYQDQIAYSANVLDWYYYLDKKVPINQIDFFNNNLALTDIHKYSDNELLKFLFKNNKNDILNYFVFAKKCEGFNSYNSENTWEKDELDHKVESSKFEKELVYAYHHEKNNFLKRKYAFQCIRLAYYNGNIPLINSVFAKEFLNSKKDYLYYWSLYFHCFTSDYIGKYNDIAEIFANCPEKAFASQFHFIDKFNLKKELQFAKNQSQVANLYAYQSARILDENLNNLRIIYQNKPNFRTLDFLLLREINKIEDWVYTPYYTNYSPSIDEEGYYSEDDESKITTETLRKRSEKDRIYALEVLNFINECDLSKVNNIVLWKSAKIQLLFITRQYQNALNEIQIFEKKYKKENVFEEIQKIKALCLTAQQEYGKAQILNQVKPFIEKFSSDNRFIFALGRELEYKGNLFDGIALISNNAVENKEYSYDANDVEWRGNRLQSSSNLDVFYNYFDYLDFVYSANNLQIIVDKLNHLSDEKLNNRMYQTLINNKDYLIDLLGTKYIREDRLNEALATFKTLNKKYWDDNYNAWERGRYDEYMSFDENPFYKVKHTPNFIQPKERYFVNKLSITEHLVKYLKLANDVARNDRDYYYFLVANCYLNMTDIGNSWMMRRFNSYTSYTEAYVNESYIDNIEYRTRTKTTQFYDLAYQNSKSDKFKALCLHMINFSQSYDIKENRLKKEYPQYEDELSNCLFLEDYFNSRR
jgi:hypothetical protein